MDVVIVWQTVPTFWPIFSQHVGQQCWHGLRRTLRAHLCLLYVWNRISIQVEYRSQKASWSVVAGLYSPPYMVSIVHHIWLPFSLQSTVNCNQTPSFIIKATNKVEKNTILTCSVHIRQYWPYMETDTCCLFFLRLRLHRWKIAHVRNAKATIWDHEW